MCKKTDFSFTTQLYRAGNNFSWCRFTPGRDALHSLGFGGWSISFRTVQDWTTQRRVLWRPVAGNQAKHAQISCITMAKWIQEQKEGERVVSKSRPKVMNVFFLSYDVEFLCRIKSDCIEKSRDVWSFGEDPVAELILQQVHSTQLQRLKWEKRMHTSAGWRTSSRKTGRMKKENSEEGTDDSESEPWYKKPVSSKWRSLWETTCKRNSRIHFLTPSGKSARIGSDMEQMSSNIVSHRSIYECRFFYGLGYLWEISWRKHERSECARGHLEKVHLHYFSNINFYRQRIWP